MLSKALGRLPAGGVYQKTLAVDLTPYPPPASNGVDAALISSWLRALAEAQPHWRWVLLTSPGNHEVFAGLESSGMRRRVTPPRPEVRMPTGLHGMQSSRPRRAWKKLMRLCGLARPPALVSQDTLLRQLDAEVLFCPFGATHYHDATVPTVVLWNDLTHLHYPQLLRPEGRVVSDRTFRQALHIADRFLCFSNQARTAVVQTGHSEARRVQALRIQSVSYWPQAPNDAVGAILGRHGLTPGQYFFYPADFEAANNHKLLLTAFGQYMVRHPDTEMQVVCAGPASTELYGLAAATALMGLENGVVFVATEAVEEQAALLQGCRAVLFPTLEGTQFAVLLHALEFGKPILCSSQANVPEIVREAALLFDPRKAGDLVQVLERAAGDAELLGTLIRKSRHQAQTLCSPRETAQQLVDVFQDAMATTRRYSDAVKGIYPDGWTAERIVVTWSAGAQRRALRLRLHGPDWLPWTHQRIHLLQDGERAHTFKLKRGQTMVVERDLPAAGGHLEFLVDPPGIPSLLGVGDDARLLGCFCIECTIAGDQGAVVLHGTSAAAA